jgi:hypothetical protein
MSHSYDIPLILSSLPEFTQLFERDGHAPKKSGGGWSVPCPFHNEKTPSCQINNARQKFHCYGCGKSGDPFDYWQKAHDLTFQQTLEELAHIAGVGPAGEMSAPRTATPKVKPLAVPILPLSSIALAKWHLATATLLDTPAEIERIATRRGVEPAAVAFAAARGLLGLYPYQGICGEAFLVERPSPNGLLPVAVHLHLAPGSKGNESNSQDSWRYAPSGCGAWPWIVGDLATADHIYLIEDPWNALSLISIMGWHLAFPNNIAVVGLRGPSSGAKFIKHSFNPQARVLFIADWSDPNSDRLDPQSLVNSIPARLTKPKRLHHFWPSLTRANFNDMVRSGEITRDLLLYHILKCFPSSRTHASGPTFLEWCRQHRADLAPIGPAAAHVVADPNRLRGRRPLAAWQTRWKRSRVPRELLKDLTFAWNTYRESCTDLATKYLHLDPRPMPKPSKRNTSRNYQASNDIAPQRP